MLYTRKNLNQLTQEFPLPEYVRCIATSQSFASPSSHVVILLNDTQLVLVFLNFFQTRVIATKIYPRTTLSNNQFRSFGIQVKWTVTCDKTSYRFLIPKTVLTLGKEQDVGLTQLMRIK